MFEYLHSLASVVLILITIVSFFNYGPLDFGKIKDAFDFLKNILHWIQFYNNFNANKEKLQERMNILNQRQADLRMEVEEREFQTGRRRKSEVDNWLSSSTTKCNDVQTLLQKIARSESIYFGKFIHIAWLSNTIEKKIEELDDLYNSGEFSEVLSPVKERLSLVTTPLVGNVANENIRRILVWLRYGVTKIGVHGIKGIGKTELVKHVYNHLSRDVNVYFIKVLEIYGDYDLQSEIAKEVGINMQEEDGPKRAAMLHRALQRKDFVLILDGVGKYFSEEKVGIPLDPTKGKMIITSRSTDVCRRIGCQRNMIAVDPLLDHEAMMLFRQQVHVELDVESQMESLAKGIVAQCRGVPAKIKEKAICLRGNEEISEWEEILHDMLMANT